MSQAEGVGGPDLGTREGDRGRPNESDRFQQKVYDAKAILSALRVGVNKPLGSEDLVEQLARMGVGGKAVAADLAFLLSTIGSPNVRLRIYELLMRLVQHREGEKLALNVQGMTDEELAAEVARVKKELGAAAEKSGV